MGPVYCLGSFQATHPRAKEPSGPCSVKNTELYSAGRPEELASTGQTHREERDAESKTELHRSSVYRAAQY